MEQSKEEIVNIARRQGDMCINIVSVIAEMAQEMLDYCREYKIRIDRNEKQNWDFIIKTANKLKNLSYSLSKEDKVVFDRNTKLFSLLMRLILARVDDSDMKLYQWYNYIKSFPADLPEIQPTAEEEAEAFKHIFQ